MTDAPEADEVLKYTAIERVLHRAIKKVGEDAVALKFNTAISQLMILLNAVEKEKQLGAEQWNALLKLLAPFAPHMAEELWHDAEHDTSIHLENHGQFIRSVAFLQDEEVTIADSGIDGKTRDEVRLVRTVASSKEEIEKAAREKVAKKLEGKQIVRTVVGAEQVGEFRHLPEQPRSVASVFE